MAMTKNRMEEKREVLKLLREIMENHQLWGFVVGEYQTDSERIRLLRQILHHLGEKSHEEMRQEVMEYGQRIREEDYIARQLFIWLYHFV